MDKRTIKQQESKQRFAKFAIRPIWRDPLPFDDNGTYLAVSVSDHSLAINGKSLACKLLEN